MNDRPTIALAGAGGDLGGRITRALIASGAVVRALVRPNVAADERAKVEATGATLLPADPGDVRAMADACAGAACVVSALNGLRNAIIDRQSVLLDATCRARVPRFVPSDFSLDFTKTRPGDNRNLDLRREFMARVDVSPVRATSVLNGAFLDMVGAEMPLVLPPLRRVLYWSDPDESLDFTTKDDVAAYTAAVALDDSAPRILRIVGDSLSARGIADAMTAVTGRRYRTLWAGTLGTLGVMIRVAKRVAPQPVAVFPPWQGMQYLRDMFSGRGKLDPLDTHRYPGIPWTSLREFMARSSAVT